MTGKSYIYADRNVFDGWDSDTCVGYVDSGGYVYNNRNVFSGFSSEACLGRVDFDTGFVYNDRNIADGWASSSCVGQYDEKGYVYNDKNVFEGYSSSLCIGHVESNGYVYVSRNVFTGFASGACVGRADGGNPADGAALLLLLLPWLERERSSFEASNESRNTRGKDKSRHASQIRGVVRAAGHASDMGSFLQGLVIITVLLGIILYAIAYGLIFLATWFLYSFVSVPGIVMYVSKIVYWVKSRKIDGIEYILKSEYKKPALSWAIPLDIVFLILSDLELFILGDFQILSMAFAVSYCILSFFAVQDLVALLMYQGKIGIDENPVSFLKRVFSGNQKAKTEETQDFQGHHEEEAGSSLGDDEYTNRQDEENKASEKQESSSDTSGEQPDVKERAEKTHDDIEKTIIKCPACGRKTRVPKNKKMYVTCDRCKYEYYINTAEESQDQSKEDQNDDEKTIIECPACKQKARVPKNKTMYVTCSRCKYEYYVNTTEYKQDAAKETQHYDEKIIIECPACGRKTRVPKNKKMYVTCDRCKYEFYINTQNQ